MNSNAELDHRVSHKVIAAPHKDVGTNVIDGTGVENAFNFENGNSVVGSRKGGSNKVSVSTVALFTLAMAAATGLGAVPFFFVELDPQWAWMMQSRKVLGFVLCYIGVNNKFWICFLQ